MARLESIAKAGFYATPVRVAETIARHLERKDGATGIVRLLDPCCGTGEAAKIVAGPLDAATYGVELSMERAADARKTLDEVLQGSAFSIKITNGAFSVLYLNPPYDQAKGEGGGRAEHAFLVSLERALPPGGVLVYIVPQNRIPHSGRFLSSHFEDIAIYKFPEPEYQDFHQIVLFGVKKGKPTEDKAQFLELMELPNVEPPALPEEPGVPYTVPVLKPGDVTFAPTSFDPLRAVAEAQRAGVWAKPELAERLWPHEEQRVQPLMPLKRGHLAQLIAAGMLNNVTLEQDDKRLLVKGRAVKKFITIKESEDKDEGTKTKVERERIYTSVMLLDLTSGEFTRVGNAPEGSE